MSRVRQREAIATRRVAAALARGGDVLAHHVLASSAAVRLRDPEKETDLVPWLRWQAGGEWRKWDAPWETMALQPTPERMGRIRQQFIAACEAAPADPRSQAIIATTEGTPIGWVLRYGESRFPDSWSVGIDIGEDTLIGRGYGSIALRLWVDYLFDSSSIHRLALATYSFNHRMLRVAEKAGFKHEGTEHELVRWDGRWHDRVRFALLRQEWESNRG